MAYIDRRSTLGLNSNSAMPGFREQPAEITAKNGADVGVGISSTDQFLRQVVHFVRVTKAIGVDLVAKRITRLVGSAQLLVESWRRIVIAGQV